MKNISYVFAFLLYLGGAVGWNSAGYEVGDTFTPMAILWPYFLAEQIGHDLYNARHVDVLPAAQEAD